MKMYTLTFFRAEGECTTSGFGQVTTHDREMAITEWAEVMYEDATRPEGTPLYNVFVHVNGVRMLTAITGEMTDVEESEEPQPEDNEYKDDVDQILLAASIECDRLLEKTRNEAHMADINRAVALGFLRPTFGPGRAN